MLQDSHPRSSRGVSGDDPEGGAGRGVLRQAARNRSPREAREVARQPKPRAAKLETPTARRRLAARKKPYWTTISPGIALGYRRNAGAGTWPVRAADGGV